MNPKGTFLLFLAIGFALAEAESVEVLTESNFDEFIGKYDCVLVKFYAPWCGHCKSMAPAFEAAGKVFKEGSTDVRFAKVDATVEKALAAKFEVQGFPTILFFKNGVPRKYTGERDEEGLITWVNRKKGPSVIQIDDQNEFDKHAKDSVLVVGVFEKPNEIFDKLADENEGKPFAIISNKDLLKSLEVEGKTGIIIFVKEDVHNLPEAEITNFEDASKFIHGHSLDLINDFSDKIAQKLFGGPIHQFVFLLGTKTHKLFETIYEDLEEVAKMYRGKLLFVYIDAENADNARIYEFIGIPLDTEPTVRILTLDDTPKKYKPDENQSVVDFIAAYFDDRATRDLKSEVLPENWKDGKVKILVGSNFNSFLANTTGYVFVKFYAPWCGHCKKLAPVWEEVAEKFVGNDEIVFAKFDSTANDLESIAITSFPILKIFKNGEEVETYQGDRSLADLEKFVNKFVNSTSSGESSSTEETSEGDDEKVHEEL